MNIYPRPSSLHVMNGKFILCPDINLYVDNEANKAAALLTKRFAEKYSVSVHEADNKHSNILFLAEAMEKEH